MRRLILDLRDRCCPATALTRLLVDHPLRSLGVDSQTAVAKCSFLHRRPPVDGSSPPPGPTSWAVRPRPTGPELPSAGVPLTSIACTAQFSSASSAGVNQTASAPLLSSMCAICVVPGMDTTQGFCAIARPARSEREWLASAWPSSSRRPRWPGCAAGFPARSGTRRRECHRGRHPRPSRRSRR